MKTLWKKFLNTKFYRTLKEYWGIDDCVALIVLILGLVYFWFDIPITPQQKLLQIYRDIHGEIIGIGITVIFLANADQYIRTKLEKERLLLQMGSPDNGFAVEAVRQMETRGWLFDGTLKKSRLYEANLSKAHLEKADLSNSILMKANLVGTNFWLANLSDCKFESANLENAILRGANCVRARFTQAKLLGAEMSETNLESADFWMADLGNTHLESANLEGASLTNSILKEANLSWANLTDARLNESDLTDASLRGACLWRACLTDAILMRTVYDKKTIWPDGFDPKAKGAIFIDMQ